MAICSENFHCLDRCKRWNGIIMTSLAHISSKYLLIVGHFPCSRQTHPAAAKIVGMRMRL
jgi:hypothetical protein